MSPIYPHYSEGSCFLRCIRSIVDRRILYAPKELRYGMDLKSPPVGSDASLESLFAIVCDVAADAAQQVDPDTCLRRLRSGLIRLGFSRAGIGIANPGDPSVWHGSWGT